MANHHRGAQPSFGDQIARVAAVEKYSSVMAMTVLVLHTVVFGRVAVLVLWAQDRRQGIAPLLPVGKSWVDNCIESLASQRSPKKL
jgi:hypothetical protein